MGPTSWDDVCAAALGEPGVRAGRRLGRDRATAGSKVLASDRRTGTVLEAPAGRVQEPSAAGGAAPFDPGMGRRTRERAHVEGGTHGRLALVRGPAAA